jgi:hypothetical protein
MQQNEASLVLMMKRLLQENSKIISDLLTKEKNQEYPQGKNIERKNQN